jgi:NRAMP (natural resistance-associated macrophage protein)-like metal ion transporter
MKSKNKKSFWSRLGPGFITGAADDDPSGIATYSQSGAHFGFTQLWTAVFSFPLMFAVQEMCGRIGLVTGDGLSGVIRKFYSKKVLVVAVVLLFIANTINVGADLGAMASTTQLLFGLPFWFWLTVITVGSLLLQIFVPYPTYAKFLKFLTLSLLAYVATAFIVKEDWSRIAWATFVPAFSFNKEYIMNIVAILGTTISPYLFFWQADEEVEEEIVNHKLLGFGFGRPRVSKMDYKNFWIDTSLGMLFSNLMMFFIIVTAASTLHANGVTNVETATQAALALEPIAGQFASLLFMVGIVGVGLLAVPILAGSASYAIAEAFGWKSGLSRKWREAPAFYGIIILSTVAGLFVNFLNIPPFTVLYYTAVINGLVAPFLLVIILLISNNKKIMGKYTNGITSNILGIAATLVMFLAGGLLFLYS